MACKHASYVGHATRFSLQDELQAQLESMRGQLALVKSEAVVSEETAAASASQLQAALITLQKMQLGASQAPSVKYPLDTLVDDIIDVMSSVAAAAEHLEGIVVQQSAIQMACDKGDTASTGSQTHPLIER